MFLNTVLAILTILSILSLSLHPILAANTNDIDFLNIQVSPATISVGDAFSVNATILNNYTIPISLTRGVCQAPLSVIFDNHVAVEQNHIICPMIAMLQEIGPGEKVTLTSPGSAITYRATEYGIVNATMTIPYSMRNQTDQSQPEIETTISKSFLFTIANSTLQTPHVVPPPLQQFKSGIAAKDVKCESQLHLIIKAEDGSPACVNLTDAAKLVTLGWAESQ